MFHKNETLLYGFISLNGKPLKLVNQFPELGSNISSTESNVNVCISKVWIGIERLSTSVNLSDKIKQKFFQVEAVLVLLYGYITRTLMIHLQKMLDANYIRMLHRTNLRFSTTKQQLYGHLPPISQTIQQDKLSTEWCFYKWCFHMDYNTWRHQCWPTSKNLHSSVLCGYWILSQVMANRDG